MATPCQTMEISVVVVPLATPNPTHMEKIFSISYSSSENVDWHFGGVNLRFGVPHFEIPKSAADLAHFFLNLTSTASLVA